MVDSLTVRPVGCGAGTSTFSWEEPPGIATQASMDNPKRDPEEDPTVVGCNLTEYIPPSRRAWGHWFRRIDRLGEITAEAPPKAE